MCILSHAPTIKYIVGGGEIKMIKYNNSENEKL